MERRVRIILKLGDQGLNLIYALDGDVEITQRCLLCLEERLLVGIRLGQEGLLGLLGKIRNFEDGFWLLFFGGRGWGLPGIRGFRVFAHTQSDPLVRAWKAEACAGLERLLRLDFVGVVDEGNFLSGAVTGRPRFNEPLEGLEDGREFLFGKRLREVTHVQTHHYYAIYD